jgi:hypothetical protein
MMLKIFLLNSRLGGTLRVRLATLFCVVFFSVGIPPAYAMQQPAVESPAMVIPKNLQTVGQGNTVIGSGIYTRQNWPHQMANLSVINKAHRYYLSSVICAISVKKNLSMPPWINGAFRRERCRNSINYGPVN